YSRVLSSTPLRRVCCVFAISSLCLFYSQFSGAHRELPAFPTRRSSDLGRDRGLDRGELIAGLGRGRGHRARHSQQRRARCPRPRSEEHTSELQSRENLVCRLLLEKKKYQYGRNR